MQIARAGAIAVPVAVSALPAAWMAYLAFVQSTNLGLSPPYWRELAFIAAFWVGLLASVAFAHRCFVDAQSLPRSALLLGLVTVGITGGIEEETKMAFPLGFFELAPISWVLSGLLARRLRVFRQRGSDGREAANL
jgi:hypothetical protein